MSARGVSQVQVADALVRRRAATVEDRWINMTGLLACMRELLTVAQRSLCCES